MIQPVDLQDFLLSFFAAAMVILSGAGYALLFTWAGLRRRPGFLYWSYAAYAVLALSVWMLAETAHFDGYWRILAALMLIGYFAAPRMIFRLCSATHDAEASHPIHPQPEKPP